MQSWMFVFLRASAFLLVLPVFSAASVPVILRVLLAAMLALLVAPTVGPVPPAAGFFSSLWRLISEVLIGLSLGFTVRIVFSAFEMAGQLITAELGLNLSSILNPVSTSPTQAPGMMLFLLATVLFFALDLHHWMIAGFAKSYAVVGPGAAHLRAAMLEHFVAQTGRIFTVALQMAAPLMAVSFVVTLVFAILGRAVSQMNVFSESFALRIAAGLFIFAMTLPLTAQHMSNALRRMPDDMMRVAQWLGGL